ncbi:MAG: diguanylate cyclase [Coprobacillus sp.]
MKSIKVKVVALVLTFVILSSLAIGTTSMLSSLSTIRSSSIENMNLICENKANKIDTLLVKIEESVKTLTVYAQHQLRDFKQFKKSDTYVNEYSKNLYDVAVNAAENTEGAATVYIRFNPSFTSSKSGLFAGKEKSDGKFISIKPTDLNAYDSDDISHVGWFYRAKESGKPIWLEPYYNANIDKEIISYIIPFYVDNEFVGIVGMDIDFRVLRDFVSQTEFYETGYAFLVDEKANIIYHKQLERGTDLINYNNGEFSDMAVRITKNEIPEKELMKYKYDGIEKKGTFRVLLNNMRFVTSVPTSEIDARSNQLLSNMFIALLVVISCAIVLTIIFTRRLVKPLIELTNAAKKIAAGDLSVSIEHRSNDEVGALAESFRQTVDQLNQQFSYINSLAYSDPLTGISNKTAYLDMIAALDQHMQSAYIEFAILAFDINNLKIINDNYGHHLGDTLIINSVKLIQEVFRNCLIYRIGGDEFVVILQDQNYLHREELISRFIQIVCEYNEGLTDEAIVSIALGVAEYKPVIDRNYNDVYRRADSAMYIDKAKTKNSHNE